MRITCVMWGSQIAMLNEAAKGLDFVTPRLYSTRTLESDPAKAAEAMDAMADSDVVLLYRSTEAVWEGLDQGLRAVAKKKPLVCLSHDPSFWAMSSVDPEVVRACYAYMIQGGQDNYAGMLVHLARSCLGLDVESRPLSERPWDGLYHPDAPLDCFASVDAYRDWYKSHAQARGIADAPWAGVLFSRHYWVNANLGVEDALIREMEAQGLRVLPAFCYGVRDKGLGTRGGAALIEDVYLDEAGNARIDVLVKLQSFFLDNARGGKGEPGQGSDLLRRLNVPVLQPVVSSHLSPEEWAESTQGLGADIAWSVALPEFEGVAEPLMLGAMRRNEDRVTGALLESRVVIPERCRRLARRVLAWARLRQTPAAERKAAFILHSNPCASVEATVGGAANLDSLESLARILRSMQETGYSIDPPQSGKSLIETIMDRKAISEFRWTTVDEIVRKGGALKRLPLDQYLEWWKEYPESVRKRMVEVWGDPPGQAKDGVPPAMVHDGHILLTGVSYGNAVVCVQPKRGCAGPRCDGQVCKILHDPDLPPPHQYVATYRYLQDGFGAHVLIHVGTHGNLEFLPGKGVGLSGSCLPDLVLHEVPHLYIYNSDNPPEGTIAKRRAAAVLVDHMQTVLVQGGLYDQLVELDRCLAEREQARITDKARAHALEHRILDLIRETNLDKEVPLGPGTVIEETLKATHEALGRVRNTQVQDGMHVFGQLPESERRVEFIRSIVRYDAGDEKSLRKTLCRAMGLDLRELLAEPGAVHPALGRSHADLLEEVENLCRDAVAAVLAGGTDLPAAAAGILGPRLKDASVLAGLSAVAERIMDIDRRVSDSRETEALLRGMEAGHIPAGPSGIITRGREDILPTGRNFYSLDPRRIPTRSAWDVGRRLAEALLDKHVGEEGRLPENVALYWMCNDIMWSDGEGMAQVLALLGARPVWLPDGRVGGVEVIPLAELGRPRVDVTVRVSGLLRDNFTNCMHLVDDAVQAVAGLDEPAHMNFVRKHSLADLELDSAESAQEQWRKATLRLFSAQPGTYLPGVNLAVYASAWKDEKDLADIFVTWNGYAYGRDVEGDARHDQLANRLRTVEVTFNKVISDEHDLFGCCSYFGSHGGLTAAARHLSGQDVKTYYGDTREPEQVAVRDLGDEIRRVVRARLLNPRWIEGMKRHGYKGAGEISKRIGRVYGWEATTREVDDWVFDDLARTYVLNEENRRFFQENNPWALEEIGRRLLEAQSRGLWQADADVLEGLREAYLETEGWLEDTVGESGGYQGGSVDVYSPAEVERWRTYMKDKGLGAESK